MTTHRRRGPFKVAFCTARMLLHIACEHPDNAKGFTSHELLADRATECRRCSKLLPQEVGGEL